jgi:hypothetical protein
LKEENEELAVSANDLLEEIEAAEKNNKKVLYLFLESKNNIYILKNKKIIYIYIESYICH